MNYFDFQNNDKDSKFIEKAIEIKREPLQELINEQKENDIKITALNNLKKELSRFDAVARRLYGFQSVFKNKSLTSSAEESISGEAFPYAAAAKYSLIIKQVAAAERLISKDFKKDILLPASTIKIKIGTVEEILFFGGGDVKDFVDEIKNSQQNLKPILINKSSTTSILILAANQTGTNHTIELLQDSGKVLLKLGFFAEERLPALPNRRKIAKQYPQFWQDNKLILPPQNEVTLPLYNNSSRKIDGERYLSFKYLKSKLTNQTITTSSNRQSNFATNSATAHRLLQKKLVAVLHLSDPLHNQRIVKITLPPQNKRVHTFVWKIESDIAAKNVSYQIEKIILVNSSRDEQYTFYLPEIYYREPKFKEPQILEKAENLIFNYEGIDIERTENTVTNFIDGVKLFFKKPSAEKINLEVSANNDSSANLVIDFINQYNKCLHLLNVYLFSQVPPGDEIEEKEKKHYSIFRSDSTIYNLRANLRNIITYPYETSQGKLLLAKIGAKTIFFREENVDNNKIQIEEEKYIEVFKDPNQLQAINEMFSYAKDEDGKINSGIAYEIRKFLKPYLSHSDNSFFKSKIKIIKDTNKSIDTRMAKLEKEVIDYRQDLEDEMIKIKQAEAEQKRAQQFLDAQNKK